MLQLVKDTVYSILVRYVYFLFPLIKMVLGLVSPWKYTANHHITDEGGSKIRTTKWNGKLYPPNGEDRLSRTKHLTVRDSDVFLCGYPKTGCHWTYEILYMLLNKTTRISKYGKVFGGTIELLPEFMIDSVPSPRILNSHLTYDELPEETKTKKTKIILTIRSAKDTVVSYYNHHSQIVDVYGYDGVFENYFKLFMTGELDYGSYFDYCLDWDRVYTSQSANEIFVLQFEDLKADPVGMIKRLAGFLDVQITDDVADDIAESSKFINMKKMRASDPMASVFFRKGMVGDWKNWLTPAQTEEIDRKWKETVGECKMLSLQAD